jgi:hypothetical protein
MTTTESPALPVDAATTESPPEVGPHVEYEMTNVPLDLFPPNEALTGEQPIGDLVAQIRAFGGLMEPVVYEQPAHLRGLLTHNMDFSDPVRLTSGTRRIKALRILLAETKSEMVGVEHGSPQMAALMLDHEHYFWVPTRIMFTNKTRALVAQLVAHATRRENLARTLATVEALEAQGMDDRAIAKESGLKVGQIKGIRNLQRLIPPIREAFDNGTISTFAAIRSCRLPASVQKDLAVILEEEGRLTYAQIEEAKRATRGQATQSVTDKLALAFGDDEDERLFGPATPPPPPTAEEVHWQADEMPEDVDPREDAEHGSLVKLATLRRTCARLAAEKVQAERERDYERQRRQAAELRLTMLEERSTQ